MRWASSTGGSVGTTSTRSPSARRASTPTSGSEPVARTRVMAQKPRASRLRLLGEDALRGAHAGAVLDGQAESRQHPLEGGEADDHVGVVDVAEVSEAEDLPLHLALAPGNGDVVLLAVGPDHRLPVHADRRNDGGDGGGRRGPRGEGEGERLHPRPPPPGRALATAVEPGAEPAPRHV